jgi:hypothetical protein
VSRLTVSDLLGRFGAKAGPVLWQLRHRWKGRRSHGGVAGLYPVAGGIFRVPQPEWFCRRSQILERAGMACVLATIGEASGAGAHGRLDLPAFSSWRG